MERGTCQLSSVKRGKYAIQPSWRCSIHCQSHIVHGRMQLGLTILLKGDEKSQSEAIDSQVELILCRAFSRPLKRWV
jgi:hypothetical protein